MARPPKLPQDPRVYAQVIEDMALGISCRLIAESLGENENTVKGWRNRSDFSRDLAIKKLEILRDPIRRIAKLNPMAFLERHPDTREDFKPPTQQQKIDANIITNAKELSDDHLAAIATGGGPGTPKPKKGAE